MINEGQAIILALKAIVEVFGADYIREKKHSPCAYNLSDDTYTLFFGFEDSESRPDLEPNFSGWTVCVTAIVNIQTGETRLEDCRLPDGSRL